MICNECLTIKPLDVCLGTYQLGVIQPSLDVKVRFLNLATGRIDYVDGSSDAEGKLTVLFSPMRHRYRVEVFNGNDKVMITVGTQQTQCLYVRFERSHNDTALTY